MRLFTLLSLWTITSLTVTAQSEFYEVVYQTVNVDAACQAALPPNGTVFTRPNNSDATLQTTPPSTYDLNYSSGLFGQQSFWRFRFNGDPIVIQPVGPGTTNSPVSDPTTASYNTGLDVCESQDIDIVLVQQDLPVELNTFTGTAFGKSVRLDWETLSEAGNEGFEVQRSRDGEHWDRVDFVAGNGDEAGNYSFEDYQATTGVNYYRLKQMDYDGAFEYSPTIMVTLSEAAAELEVFPNPATDAVNVRFSFEGSHMVRLYDAAGSVVKEYQASGLRTSVDVSELRSGTYLLSVTDGEETRTQRVIKR